jgi:hypothetical protein
VAFFAARQLGWTMAEARLAEQAAAEFDGGALCI